MYHKILCFVILLSSIADTLAAESSQREENIFMGINWEFSMSIPEGDVDSLNSEAVSLVFTLGHRDYFRGFPVRLRAGIGWYPEKPFRFAVGTEFALYEVLNRAKARMFGIYLVSDVTAEMTDTTPIQANISGGILIPLTTIGGIFLSCGIDTEGNPIAALSIMSGGYVQ